MRLSIVLSTQPASFSALAYKGRLYENITKIKGLKYDGIELAVRDTQLLDLDDLKTLLAINKLPVCALGTGQAYGEEGLSFTDPDEQIRQKAIIRIKSHMKLAENLGSVVIIGLVRGKKSETITNAQTDKWLLAAIRECASYLGEVKLVIEPINRYETNLINTVAEGLHLVNKIGMDNVGLLLDTFHMNIEERSFKDSILAAKDRLFHFHIADSNRCYPGAGHIDFRDIIDILHSIDYKQFLSAEILPLPDADTAAKMTIKNIRQIIN